MQLHLIQPGTRRKRTKRIGRGGKRGTYSGKGEKGQRKRSGHRIRPAARDIVLKFPKLRGVKHKSRRLHTVAVNVGDLAALVERLGGREVTRESLVTQRIIRRVTDLVKILGDGEVSVGITVRGIPVSRSAREKIEKAGGKISA